VDLEIQYSEVTSIYHAGHHFVYPAESIPFTQDTISVTINGEAVSFTDQEPVIIDGRTLVPVRGVFEALGFDVSLSEIYDKLSYQKFQIIIKTIAKYCKNAIHKVKISDNMS